MSYQAGHLRSRPRSPVVNHAGPLHALPSSDRTRSAVCGAGPVERTSASWDLLAREQRCPDCQQLMQGDFAESA